MQRPEAGLNRRKASVTGDEAKLGHLELHRPMSEEWVLV